MKPNVIVDIDGTCSNAEHRKYLIDGSQPKKDWDLFYDMCHLDTAHTDVRELLWILTWNRYCIRYFTGRVERVREKTERWLRDYGFPNGPLTMRPDGDYTMDALLKQSWVFEQELTPGNTFLVLDDRDQVVKMWRGHGFRCLQVADGAF